MKIRKYSASKDEDKLMQIIKGEGEDWSCYWKGDAAEKYKIALKKSITYVAYEGENLCGYSRSLDDYSLYIFVCDLLVVKKYRGKQIGRELVQVLLKDYPDKTVYVMSDVDEYYEKQRYVKEGSIYKVPRSKEKKS